MSVPPAHGNEYVPVVAWAIERLMAHPTLEGLVVHRRPVPEDAAAKHLTYQYMASIDANTPTGGYRVLSYVRLQITARAESESLEDVQAEADAIDEALQDQGGIDPSGLYVCHALRVRVAQPEQDPTAGGRRWTELGGVYEIQAHRIA
jgi:hypothetical protein